MPETLLIQGAVDQASAVPLSYWWVQPLVTGIAAATAILVAFFTIRANINIARLRATLDHIERAESQEYYQPLSETFRIVRQKNQFSDLIDTTGDEEKEQLKSKLFFFLNHYELIAVSFKMRILDNKFYSLFMRDTVCRDWLASKAFVEAVRLDPAQPLPSLYTELQAVAEKWQAEIDLEASRAPAPKRAPTHRHVVRYLARTPPPNGSYYRQFVVVYVFIAVRRLRKLRFR